MSKPDEKPKIQNKQVMANPYIVPKIVNGGIAGIVGVSVVFPLDLVKTRLQNQTIGPKGEKQYKNITDNGIAPEIKNSGIWLYKEHIGFINLKMDEGLGIESKWIDCFKKTYAAEGYFGMYRGSAVNIILITPEKAIKLACNDLYRYYLTRPDGSLPLFRQCIAGGGAGACQIVITTPMELLKIQMQDAGRVAAQAKAEGKTFHRVTAMELTRKLIAERGIFGLYRGIGATACRDITFSMIYFPMFATVNESGFRNADNSIPFWWSFLSGLIAGSSAAICVNPMDVIKTRLQTIAKGSGEKQYSGIIDCMSSTLKNEGITAFFKGGLCRVIVIAPLFGIAQSVYYLGIAERLLGYPF